MMSLSLLISLLVSFVSAQVDAASCIFEQDFNIDVNEDLVDKAKFGDGSIDVIQTTQKLLLLDANLNLLNTTQGPKNYTYQCNKVIGYSLSNTFFVGCQQNGSLAILQAYQCQQANCKLFGETVYIPLGVQLFDKAIIIGNTLLILQADKILFYTIVMQTTSWYLRTTSYVLDKQFFNRSSLSLTDFDLKLYSVDSQINYKILIVEQNYGVLWVNTILRTNNLVPYNSGSISLRSIYNLKSTTKFRSAAILSAQEESIEFVVSTNDEDNYQILYRQSSAILSSVLNRYKDWTQINYVSINGNVVAIPYQNYQGTVVTPLFKISTAGEVKTKIILRQEYQDLLISSSLKHFLLYFTDSNSVIYKTDADSLTKCVLSKYNNSLIE